MNSVEVAPGRAGRKAGSSQSRRQSRRWALAAYGQGLVEYALILALIAIIVIGVLTQLGGQTSHIFSSVNCTLAGGTQVQTTSTGPGNSGAQTGSSSGATAAGSTTTGDC